MCKGVNATLVHFIKKKNFVKGAVVAMLNGISKNRNVYNAYDSIGWHMVWTTTPAHMKGHMCVTSVFLYHVSHRMIWMIIWIIKCFKE